MAIDNQKPVKVKITIRRVKEKYLSCKDIKLKKHIGQKMAGDIKWLE